MHIFQALRNQAAKIRADVENSKLFAQMVDRGSHREAIIKQFLRPFLPECYGLSSGEVFSSDGQQSAQIDIVVYDAVFSTVLFRDGPNQLFPAESVYGAVEVKSDLSLPELDRACGNSRRLKELRRSPTDSLDFTPVARLDLGHGLTCTDRQPRNPYATFAFGFRGASGASIAADLNGRAVAEPDRKQLLPDFVFVADPGAMILRYKHIPARQEPVFGPPEIPQPGSGPMMPRVTYKQIPERYDPVLPGAEFDAFGYLDCRAEALPLFFLTLNVCLGQIRLRAVDYNALWAVVVRGLVHPKGNEASSVG